MAKNETRLRLPDIKEPTGNRASVFAIYEYVDGDPRFVRFDITQRGRPGRKPGKRRGRKPGPKPGSRRRKLAQGTSAA
jgi:hypothetical protein